MAKSTSERIIATPSSHAREHYLYVQEVGTLQSLEPHISRRQNLNSYLFFIVLKGSGYVSYDGSRFNIAAGDCVWLDCTKPYSHESSASDPWSLMWVRKRGASFLYELSETILSLFVPSAKHYRLYRYSASFISDSFRQIFFDGIVCQPLSDRPDYFMFQ